jgi:acetyl-CoA synthetase
MLDQRALEFERAEAAGLMRGYLNEVPTEGAYYRTGDVASRDAEGYITYVGRADDVFKSSGYRDEGAKEA